MDFFRFKLVSRIVMFFQNAARPRIMGAWIAANPFLFAVLSGFVAWTIGAVTTLAIAAAGLLLSGAPITNASGQIPAVDPVLTLLVAPIVENAILILVLTPLVEFHPLKTALGIGVVVAVVHGLGTTWFNLTGPAALFALMTLTWLYKFGWRWHITTCVLFFQHFVFNLPAVLLALT